MNRITTILPPNHPPSDPHHHARCRPPPPPSTPSVPLNTRGGLWPTLVASSPPRLSLTVPEAARANIPLTWTPLADSS